MFRIVESDATIGAFSVWEGDVNRASGFQTRPQAEAWIVAERKARRNEARRERHDAMVSLGLKRVRGALGGVYYE